mmetsp:Transcript_17070/g.20741  ORF Transcript_17070/g.20741 Transcript_17070/m.20741 type:complete len:91 (+) Transcript_17070:323-595(+)
MTFDEDSTAFHLDFRFNNNLSHLTTVVLIPPLLYPLNISVPSLWLTSIHEEKYGAVLLHIEPPSSLPQLPFIISCTIQSPTVYHNDEYKV